MNDRIALTLALFIIALIAFDVFHYNGEHLIFLTHKIMDLVDYLIFWN